ncbi:MAG TPA: polysaccharide ABC transporter ATP-binding protein [Vicinamibacterales bacterium]
MSTSTLPPPPNEQPRAPDSLVVEDLGKRYFLASRRVVAPRRTLNLGVARVPIPRLSLPGRVLQGRDLWALRHVSFTVPARTILGVIGANGAGKSTLLKVIARVTRPTEGRVTGVGRVVSLLELGAGFNPDFSAHDNILMNAAMHGISRREVLDRMAGIIQFAELDDFLDNPLRQYSSGMYLRLAFSVAINMQPNILLADEILAVGDIAFQERCLQRVAEESERGLTVLFVSHDMSAVSRLCHRVIWLDKGEAVQDGEPEEVIAEYEEAALRGRSRDLAFGRPGRHINVVAEIASVRLLNSSGEEIGAAPTAEDVYLRIRLKIRKPGSVLRAFADVYAKRVAVFRTTQPEEVVADRRGLLDLLVRIPAHLLADTTYTVNVTIYTVLGKETKVVLDNALTFMAYGPESGAKVKRGVVAPRLDWTVQIPVRVRKRRKSVV